VVGYVRVSTDEQRLGPEAQLAALRAWCEARGAELVSVHEDHGVSGAAELDKRPGLLAALDALSEHGAGVLLVAKRDRLARDVIVAAMVERMADRSGAAVVAADGAGEGEGPEALLMRRMVDAFAEYERAMIRARTRAALAAKSRRGERTGQVPFGYALAADGVRLVEHPGEQAVIREIREMRAAGMSLRAIADAVNAECNAGRRMHASLVGRLVKVEAAA
jgi:DNA invertase Pin-like site-specific DNA recombinase